jgi:hypothetical protein
MPGYNSQRRGTARTLPKIFVLFYVFFVLCPSLYCLCVNVCCTAATGCQSNCSLTNISYHILFLAKEALLNQGKDGQTNSLEDVKGLAWGEGECIVPFILKLVRG